MQSSDTFTTLRGTYSKARFNALLNVRQTALDALREALKQCGYTEVTVASLVNIAGSCENPHASFTLDYYGRQAHLSQSAQIQLEDLVLRLKRPVFTVNNSFREEDYVDPQAQGRRLSEFTLVEPERSFDGLSPEQALDKIIVEETEVVKHAVKKVISLHPQDITTLGGDVPYLEKVTQISFERISYDHALQILNKQKGKQYAFGDDLGIEEEQEILHHFGNNPVFVTNYPASIKFFNMKRTPDGKRVYSVDLLTPRLGEASGGAVREERTQVIEQQLRASRVGSFIKEKGMGPIEQFADYFLALNQEQPLVRGGYGIGFERFIGVLINTNDILQTIGYRTQRPTKN